MIAGGTDFMYDGPDARTPGVMHTPRGMLSILARGVMGDDVLRAQVSTIDA
jgi:hypothetical protein